MGLEAAIANSILSCRSCRAPCWTEKTRAYFLKTSYRFANGWNMRTLSHCPRRKLYSIRWSSSQTLVVLIVNSIPSDCPRRKLFSIWLSLLQCRYFNYASLVRLPVVSFISSWSCHKDIKHTLDPRPSLTHPRFRPFSPLVLRVFTFSISTRQTTVPA